MPVFSWSVQARLLWRSTWLCLLYSLQVSVLLMMGLGLVQALAANVVMDGQFWRQIVLVLGLLLPSLGYAGGVWLLWQFHSREEPLYLNHGLSRPLRWLVAWLGTCLLSGLMIVLVSVNGRALLLKYDWQALYTQLLGRLWGGLGWGLAVLLLGGLGLGIYLLTTPAHDPEDPLEAPVDYAWQVDSVFHAYGDKAVLKGAWMKVCSHEIVGLLGRNGCGKSTLLRIMAGTCRVQQAAQQINGVFVARAYAEPGLVAWLPQASFLPPRMRVSQAFKLFENSDWLRTDALIRRIWRQRVGQLSGGETRLLELGLILSLPRAFYLLDEPFSELAPLQKVQASQWLEQAATQAGLVVSDHDYLHILALSTRLLLMRSGQVWPINGKQDLANWYLPE